MESENKVRKKAISTFIECLLIVSDEVCKPIQLLDPFSLDGVDAERLGMF